MALIARLAPHLRRLDLSSAAAADRGATLDAVEGRIVGAAVPLAVAAVVVQSAGHLVNLLLLDREYWIIDADLDRGVFTWASSVATFAAGAAVLLLSLIWESRRRLLVALAAALGYLALDDMFALHDRLAVRLEEALVGPDGELLGVDGLGRVIWPVLLLPLLAFVFAGLWAVSTTLRRRPARLLRGGLVLLALGVALEVLSIAVVNAGFEGDDLPYQLQVTAEEGVELAGWIAVALALTAGLLGTAAARLRV